MTLPDTAAQEKLTLEQERAVTNAEVAQVNGLAAPLRLLLKILLLQIRLHVLVIKDETVDPLSSIAPSHSE